MCRLCLLLATAMSQLAMSAGFIAAETTLTGTVIDAATNRPLPVRLYIQSAAGRWFFAKSASPQGTAVEYRKQRSPSEEKAKKRGQGKRRDKPAWNWE